mmetsp:Transcript_1910/g.6263  ORF Transcript_1910/g.6263 Transcript_1910/m.6263 type:complete len:368 (+) Transcript_1910:89-1192(+)
MISRSRLQRLPLRVEAVPPVRLHALHRGRGPDDRERGGLPDEIFLRARSHLLRGAVQQPAPEELPGLVRETGGESRCASGLRRDRGVDRLERAQVRFLQQRRGEVPFRRRPLRRLDKLFNRRRRVRVSVRRKRKDALDRRRGRAAAVRAALLSQFPVKEARGHRLCEEEQTRAVLVRVRHRLKRRRAVVGLRRHRDERLRRIGREPGEGVRHRRLVLLRGGALRRHRREERVHRFRRPLRGRAGLARDAASQHAVGGERDGRDLRERGFHLLDRGFLLRGEPLKHRDVRQPRGAIVQRADGVDGRVRVALRVREPVLRDAPRGGGGSPGEEQTHLLLLAAPPRAGDHLRDEIEHRVDVAIERVAGDG